VRDAETGPPGVVLLTMSRHRRSLAAPLLLTACGMLAVTCSSPTLPSTTTIIPPPAITCPIAPPSIATGNGRSATVTYGSPSVTGGTAPVSASCTPPTGSTFAVGSSLVTCTATDAVRRSASCSFPVTVTLPPPRLGITTILAFGDSITEGEVPVAGEFGIRPRFVEPDKSYPADLTTLLAMRYTAQGALRIDAFSVSPSNCWNDPPPPTTSGIVVINAGCLGERAQDAGTLARLNDKIAIYHPDVVLLLEGANDLSTLSPGASIAAGVQGVQTLIAAARTGAGRVMVGTLLPEIATDLTHGGAPALIVPFNAQLVPAATAAGARVVDLYSDIAMDATDWISPYDGLHPTEAGYQEIARVWFANVQSAYELTAAVSSARYRSTIAHGTRH
jgi:lysophospholipase L1-like esterase